MNNQKSIDFISNYANLRKHLNNAQKTGLDTLLGITEEDRERCLGLEKENEFIIMIYLLGWVKNFVSIDESNSPLTKTVTSDLLVETINERKLSIEIKSTKKDVFNFSRSQIEKKSKFAESIGYEPYLAISINGHWMLFSNKYFLDKNCKITIEDDYLNSELESLLGERLFLFPKGLEIFSIYSKTKKGLGIFNNEYGETVSIRIKTFGKKIKHITSFSSEWLPLSFVLENVHDVMSNQSQEIIKLDSDRTLIKEAFSEDFSMLKLSCFLMSPIKHMINPDADDVYDLAKYKELIKKDNTLKLNRQTILAYLTWLDDNGYPVYMYLDNKGYRIKDLQVKTDIAK